MPGRHRNWCFTLNNYKDSDQHGLAESNCRYIIWGREIGASGTRHLQGYVEFDKAYTMSSVKKHIKELERAHLEPRRGSQSQARDYCMKDGDFSEHGTRKMQGRRGDLDKTRELAVTEGMRSVTEVCNLQQIRVAEKYLEYNEKKRDWETMVIWIHGPSGCGKSRMAQEIVKGEDYYWKSDNSKWWPGYDGHEIIIWDDFRDGACTFTEWLTLTDRYPKLVELKGGSRQILAKTIIFTSIEHPRQVFMYNDNEDYTQVERRINEIVCLGHEKCTGTEVGGNTGSPTFYGLY